MSGKNAENEISSSHGPMNSLDIFFAAVFKYTHTRVSLCTSICVRSGVHLNVALVCRCVHVGVCICDFCLLECIGKNPL